MSIELSKVFQQAANSNTNGNTAGVSGLAAYAVDVQFNSDTAVVNFEGQCSDQVTNTTVWRAVAAEPLAGGSVVTNTNADGAWVIKCAGLSQIRCRISGHSAGTNGVTVQGYGSYVPRW